MLDSDLASLYGVSTGRLNQQVRRNKERFPEDFAFQLTAAEVKSLRSQIAISNRGRGGRRYLPMAFTEHGALMAAGVLNSPIAIGVSIEIVRAFVRVRQMLTSNAELLRKLEALESKYDAQFKVVFRAIRELMEPPKPAAKRIGFEGAKSDA